MPHSLDDPQSSPAAVKDEPMEEDAGIPNGVDAAASNADDDDVDMVGAPDSSAAVKKEDVKLEQLFDDVDSDEEFPSSAPVKAAPSSPQAPASPM